MNVMLVSTVVVSQSVALSDTIAASFTVGSASSAVRRSAGDASGVSGAVVCPLKVSVNSPVHGDAEQVQASCFTSSTWPWIRDTRRRKGPVRGRAVVGSGAKPGWTWACAAAGPMACRAQPSLCPDPAKHAPS